MSSTFFRTYPADEDPADLLDPENQWSTPWGSPDHGPCDKCGGEGPVEYRCLSCTIERDPGCPACSGRVRYLDVCPACEGDGVIERTKRRGVSAFPTLRGLLAYLEDRDNDLDGHVIVELEGEPSGERDLDADAGAVLVIPTRIMGRRPLPR